MSGDSSRPELVIAIDFGMTCMILLITLLYYFLLILYIGTGVAYCNVATGEETVRWIQQWPGRANAVENKVSHYGSRSQPDRNMRLYTKCSRNCEGPYYTCIPQIFYNSIVMGFPFRKAYRTDE